MWSSMNSQTLRWRPTWWTWTPPRRLTKSVSKSQIWLQLVTRPRQSRQTSRNKLESLELFQINIKSSNNNQCEGEISSLARTTGTWKRISQIYGGSLVYLTSLSLELISRLSCQLSLEIFIEIKKYNNKYITCYSPPLSLIYSFPLYLLRYISPLSLH